MSATWSGAGIADYEVLTLLLTAGPWTWVTASESPVKRQ
jgi:hypothetical protein